MFHSLSQYTVQYSLPRYIHHCIIRCLFRIISMCCISCIIHTCLHVYCRALLVPPLCCISNHFSMLPRWGILVSVIFSLRLPRYSPLLSQYAFPDCLSAQLSQYPFQNIACRNVLSHCQILLLLLFGQILLT